MAPDPASADPRPSVSVAAGQVLRLELKPRAPTAAHTDGAWWPRSDDLASELPALLAAVSVQVGTVALVGYHHNAWSRTPGQLFTEAGTVELQGFTSDNPHTVIVVGAGGQNVTLLVIPPNSTNAAARRAFTDASRLESGDSGPEGEAETPIDRSLDAVAARLARIDGTTDSQRVAAIAGWVREAAVQFADAPIQGFVPILVEHIVRQKLRPHDVDA